MIFSVYEREIKPVNPKVNQSWIFTGRTDAEAENPILWPPDGGQLTRLKRPWCWERLKVVGEGDNRGWDGWMVSPTQWTWVWVNSGSWWWTGKPGVLQFMVSQRVKHDWATELNWTELKVMACTHAHTSLKILINSCKTLGIHLSCGFLRMV